MSRSLKVIIAATLVAAGVIGCLVFLTGQGLDRATQWVSIVGTAVSAGVGVVGLVLAWQARPSGSVRSQVRVARTGTAIAHGAGSRASTGRIGHPGSGLGPATVTDTGDATATDGGRASTGDDQTQ